VTQRDQIVLKMRELILNGGLAPGQRVAEIPLSERLGVSRTPVRHALAVLANEGLLVAAGARGYVVRAFTLKDILDAIEVRGLLEGMAARIVAESGVDTALADDLASCLDEGEAIVHQAHYDIRDDARWAAMNERFHGRIVEASGNDALARALSLNDKLPFATASALLGGDTDDPELLRRHREVLVHAHAQHRAIVEALHRGQSARVEALMREHALAAHNNIVLFRATISGITEEAGETAAIPVILGELASGGNLEEEEYHG
jgi:GntR family transcriptional regulator of vanillate catabolism